MDKFIKINVGFLSAFKDGAPKSALDLSRIFNISEQAIGKRALHLRTTKCICDVGKTTGLGNRKTQIIYKITDWGLAVLATYE